jgi:ribosomal 50S subunit-associated protein YjgA (DUF615 family)
MPTKIFHFRLAQKHEAIIEAQRLSLSKGKKKPANRTQALESILEDFNKRHTSILGKIFRRTTEKPIDAFIPKNEQIHEEMLESVTH